MGLWKAASWGCTGPPPGTAGGDTGADADSDADGDTDSDADTDRDTDTDGNSDADADSDCDTDTDTDVFIPDDTAPAEDFTEEAGGVSFEKVYIPGGTFAFVS